MCRLGIYQYEHIIPEFVDAKEHNAENICCLCASCHDKVTRGQLSKKTVQQQYHQTQRSNFIGNPSDFFDFKSSRTKLKFGNLIVQASPKVVFKCYNETIFSIEPGSRYENGKISAIFSDQDGEMMFEIRHNEWIGPTTYYDLEIVGRLFKLRLPSGEIALQLRSNPPHEVIIERLDMRFKDIHLLISDKDLAIGRYTGYGNNLIWFHVKARIDRISNSSVAIQVDKVNATKEEYKKGISLSRPKFAFDVEHGLGEVMNVNSSLNKQYNTSLSGIFWSTMGIKIAQGCKYSVGALIGGVCSIDHARKWFFRDNKVNKISYFLPLKLNTEIFEREAKLSTIKDGLTTRDFNSPFLIIPDKVAIKEWQSRQSSKTMEKEIIVSPFIDDKPGDYFSGGVFEIVETYKGPGLSVIKPNRGEVQMFRFNNQSYI